MAKKYDIRVGEIDYNGQKKWHEESGIMASSIQELVNIYKMCGQEIQVIREYEDETSRNYGKQKLLKPEDVKMDTSYGGTGLMKMSDDESKKVNEFINHHETQKINDVPSNTSNIQNNNLNNVNSLNVKEQTKFFTVGGIKCKIENGKLYQKQWLQISEDEANEIRIVSDKNNKICQMKGKHFEVMKWVLIDDKENSNKNEDERILING